MSTIRTTLLKLIAVAVTLVPSMALAENLFVTGFDAGVIYEFTSTGYRSTFATGLSHPAGLAFDTNGNLFVADGDTGNIFKYTPGGVRSTFASGLTAPSGIAFDSSGNLFVAQDLSQILKFTPGGTQSLFTTVAPGALAYSLAFAPDGNLFAGTNQPDVLKITPDGNWTYQPATTNFPLGIAFDANGYRYMSDALGNNVDRTSPADVTTHWITGLPGTTGLAFDSEGRLFVADVSGNINSYAPDGTHLPYAASGVGQIWDAAIRVSEPSTFGLMALGIGVLAIARRNRRQLRV